MPANSRDEPPSVTRKKKRARRGGLDDPSNAGCKGNEDTGCGSMRFERGIN